LSASLTPAALAMAPKLESQSWPFSGPTPERPPGFHHNTGEVSKRGKEPDLCQGNLLLGHGKSPLRENGTTPPANHYGKLGTLL
jgi:hypothetical protein